MLSSLREASGHSVFATSPPFICSIFYICAVMLSVKSCARLLCACLAAKQVLAARMRSRASGSPTLYKGTGSYSLATGSAGACGSVYADTDLTAALSPDLYKSDLCNRLLWVNNPTTDRTIKVLVTDACTGGDFCDSAGDVVFSKAAFLALGGDVAIGGRSTVKPMRHG